jgi:hypothetical protein
MIRLFKPRLFRRGPPQKPGLALGLALGLTAIAATAQAASVYTVQVTANVDLGKITSAATGDTVFRVDPTTGNVSIFSGNGTRSGNGTARAMVTISCTGVAGDCNKNINVRLAVAGAPIGRGRALTRITFQLGTAVFAGLPGLPGAPNFTIGPIGVNSSKTFFVGADFGIAGDDSGLPTGLAEADFSVAAGEAASPPAGPTGRFTATVLRQLSITKTRTWSSASSRRRPPATAR